MRGGPAPQRRAAHAGLVDELFLSFSPLLAGGGEEGVLRIIAGRDLQPPVSLRLLSVAASESELFLRYGV